MNTKKKDPIALSSSAITAFEHCPYQFFELRKRRDIEKVTDHLELGNIVHKALYLFYDPENKEELIDIYKAEWSKGSVSDMEIYKAGLDMLERFKVKFGEGLKDREILTREYKFELPLGESYMLRGIFDRVDKLNDEGDYEIIDYKTSLTPKTQDEINIDLQLAIYDYAFHKLVEAGAFGDITPPRNVYMSMLFVRYEKLSTLKSDEDREALRDFLEVTAKQINECTEPKKKLNPYCAWCMFKNVCEVYNLGSDSELFKESIDFMDEEALMQEYKRVNYLATVVDDRKKRIANILRTKLELMGTNSFETGRYKCYLQNKSFRNYNIEKVKEILEPLGLFSEVCKIRTKDIERVSKEYGLEAVIDDATYYVDVNPILRIKKL